MRDNRVTIKELAHLSGVSIGTVSRALNGYTDVQPGDARARSCASLASSTTRPPPRPAASSPSARTSSACSSRPARATPTCSTRSSTRSSSASSTRSARAATTCCSSPSEHPGNGYGDHSYLKRARHHSVEGVVLMGVDAEDLEVRRLTRSGLPVRRRRRRARRARDRVRDVRQPGRRGRSPSAICTISATAGSRRSPASSRRARAPTASGATATRCARAGLAFRDEYVAYGDFYVESGQRAMARLLALDEPPTAVVCGLGHDGPRRDPGRRRGRPVGARGPLDRRLRRHPARRPRRSRPLTTLRQDKARPRGGGRPCAAARSSPARSRPRRGGHAPRRARRPRVHRARRRAGSIGGGRLVRRITLRRHATKTVFVIGGERIVREQEARSWRGSPRAALALVVAACGGDDGDKPDELGAERRSRRPCRRARPSACGS